MNHEENTVIKKFNFDFTENFNENPFNHHSYEVELLFSVFIYSKLQLDDYKY